MSNRTFIRDIPQKTWRALIAALSSAGWSVQTGGGLDFSWALVSCADVMIEMEYDIWCGGEMIFATTDGPIIKGDLSYHLLAKLRLE